MRGLLIALSLLVSASVHAADISLPLNDDEQRALREILDLATKAGGLPVAQATVHFATKLEVLRRQAAQLADKPAPSTQ